MNYDVFCDESRHLEHDQFRYMVLGGIWCVSEWRRDISSLIENMKREAGFSGELKWTKINYF